MEKYSKHIRKLLILITSVAFHLCSGVNPVSTLFPMGWTTYRRDLVEPDVVVKIIYSISYDKVRVYMNEPFQEELKTKLSKLFGVTLDRISGVDVFPDYKGRTIVSFKLSTGGTFFLTNKIALDFFDTTKKSDNVLIVNTVEFSPLIQYCRWTEGACPFDNQCIENCKQDPNLYPLLVLLIIPVIIAVVIVLLWFFKYKKPAEKKRINLTDLGYVENRSKYGETVASRKGTISGISLADNGIRNKVYTVMGQKYGFSIDNAEFNVDEDSERYT